MDSTKRKGKAEAAAALDPQSSWLDDLDELSDFEQQPDDAADAAGCCLPVEVLRHSWKRGQESQLVQDTC